MAYLKEKGKGNFMQYAFYYFNSQLYADFVFHGVRELYSFFWSLLDMWIMTSVFDIYQVRPQGYSGERSTLPPSERVWFCGGRTNKS